MIIVTPPALIQVRVHPETEVTPEDFAPRDSLLDPGLMLTIHTHYRNGRYLSRAAPGGSFALMRVRENPPLFQQIHHEIAERVGRALIDMEDAAKTLYRHAGMEIEVRSQDVLEAVYTKIEREYLD